MKIYNKIVFDFNFNIIEEDSYEYHGEIALCDGGGGGGDVSAQGMADAQANSEAGSLGGYAGESSAYDAQVNSMNFGTNTGWGYNANASSFSPMQFAKDTGKYGLPVATATGNIAIGLTAGAAKAGYNQAGAISNAFASSPPDSFSTTTGMNTSQSAVASTEGVPDNYVWDGKAFVSPTSTTGQQAIAQLTGATSGMATSNLSLEDQLKTEQLEILRQQRSETDALNKLVYQAAGIIKDPTTGEWRKATETERRTFMTDTESKEYDIYLQQLDRQKQALEGKLPVSPALEREISDWDAQNQESLTRRLGSDYMTSTPGIQSQARQEERTGLLREEARRGEIAAGSSRVMDWKNSLNNANAQGLNTLSAIPGRTSGLLTGYANTLVPYTQQASINAANDRQASVLAQDTYWRRQASEDKQTQSKWSTIGTLGGYLFS